MRFEVGSVTSISGLIETLQKQFKATERVWFRGHGAAHWTLTPSIMREKNGLERELAVYKRFVQNALPMIDRRPASESEWLFAMQHYRAPTRLLDWTESPLIGLYFAVADEEHPSDDGALWCLLPDSLNALSPFEGNFQGDLPSFEIDDFLRNYLPTVMDKDRTTKFPAIAAIAARNTPRIAAQRGVFTVAHRRLEPIEKIGDASHVGKIVIPAASKGALKAELAYLGIDHLRLFPELESAGRSAAEVLKW